MSSYGYSSPSQPSSVPSAPSTPSPPAQQVTYTPPAPISTPTPVETTETTPPPTSPSTPRPVRVRARSTNQPIDDGPIDVEGYYPLYRTSTSAVAASPSPTLIREGEDTIGYHTHRLGGVVYYMPNGLEMGVTQFHGDYGMEPESSETVSGSRVFVLKNDKGNYVPYSKGEVVLYEGNLYEVISKNTFAKLPTDTRYFRLITKETSISNVIDGGEF